MPPQTKNLGLVKAIHVGVNPPINKKMIWYNENPNVNLHFYWDIVELIWKPFGGGDSCCGITEVTFEELQTLISNEELIPGSLYGITDFQTVYDRPDFDINGLPKDAIDIQTITAPIRLLIVTAMTTSLLYKEAVQPDFPKDRLCYDVNFTQTEVKNTPAKGRITERIDELNNRTDYDHVDILFKRYESIEGSGIFDTHRDTGFTSTEKKTFAWDEEITGFGQIYSNNNYIGDVAIYHELYGDLFILANNVFDIYCEGNRFGTYCRNNTIGGSCYYNNVGDAFYSNEIGSYFLENNIDSYFTNNIIGNDFSHNKISEGFRSNSILGVQFVRNNISFDFLYNQIDAGTNFSENNIATGFYMNSFNGGYFARNDIKRNCVGNTFNSNSNVQNNILPEQSTSNNIDGTLVNCNFNFSFDLNNVATGSIMIQNTFDKFVLNIVTGSLYDNKSEVNFSQNNISGDMRRNILHGRFEQNDISSSQFYDNFFNIQLYFANNDISSSSFQLNKLNCLNCEYNDISGNFDRNVIQEFGQANTVTSTFGSNEITNFTLNIVNGYFSENRIRTMYGTIVNVGTDICTQNDFWYLAYCIIEDFRNNKNISYFDSVDFSSATHAKGFYDCEIYKRPDGTMRLRYFDNTDTQIITNITA